MNFLKRQDSFRLSSKNIAEQAAHQASVHAFENEAGIGSVARKITSTIPSKSNLATSLGRGSAILVGSMTAGLGGLGAYGLYNYLSKPTDKQKLRHAGQRIQLLASTVKAQVSDYPYASGTIAIAALAGLGYLAYKKYYQKSKSVEMLSGARAFARRMGANSKNTQRYAEKAVLTYREQRA